jgi:prophage regulatory protein
MRSIPPQFASVSTVSTAFNSSSAAVKPEQCPIPGVIVSGLPFLTGIHVAATNLVTPTGGKIIGQTIIPFKSEFRRPWLPLTALAIFRLSSSTPVSLPRLKNSRDRELQFFNSFVSATTRLEETADRSMLSHLTRPDASIAGCPIRRKVGMSLWRNTCFGDLIMVTHSNCTNWSFQREFLTADSIYGGSRLTNTILRLPQVKARVGLSRSTIYLRVSDGSFPRPVSLGARAVGWLESDVEAWICRKIEESGHNSATANCEVR